MTMENKLIKPSPELDTAIQDFKEDMYKLYRDICEIPTPFKDFEGNEIRKNRPDGYEYIISTYMEELMHQHFPGWYVEEASPMEINPSWVTAKVHVVLIDWGLYARGVSIEYCKRKFYGADSIRVQYSNCPCKWSNKNQDGKPIPKRSCLKCEGTGSLPYTPENIVDLGNNTGSAITAVTKRAIRLATGIGNDVYRKRLDFNEEVGDKEVIE